MKSHRNGTVAAVAVISIAVAGPVALAAQNATGGPAPRSAPTQKGLLDPILDVVTGLTDTLKSLLGSTGLANLTSLTSALNSGSDPSSAALAPVTDLLNDLALGDPANAALLSSIAQLTASGSDGPLATPFLEPLADVLGQLAALDGLTGAQASALSNLQAALNAVIAGALPTDAVAGLPLADLPLDSTQLLALGDLLGLLQGGTASSPALLAPVSDLLDTVAITSGLPAPIGDIIATLSGQLRSAPSLDADLLTQVGQLLNAIGATPGVSGDASGLLALLSGLLGSAGTPPTGTTTTTPPATTTTKPPATTTTKPPTTTTTTTTTKPPATTGTPGATPATAKVAARVKSARYDRKRGSLVLTLSCPTGKGACGSIIYALSGARSVVVPRIVLLKDGQVVERRLKLDAKSRRALKKKAVKLTIYAITSKTQVASRGLKIVKAKTKR